MPHVQPTHTLLRDRFFYDFKEGILVSKTAEGRITGKLCLFIDGHQYYMHRLVWTYFHGKIPESGRIANIDGDPTNNRVENLKLRGASEVCHSVSRSSATGYRGVYRCDCKRVLYKAVVVKGRKVYRLGRFCTPEEAARAYNKKAVELYGAEAVINEGV